mgnify:CR=1 FL=1
MAYSYSFLVENRHFVLPRTAAELTYRFYNLYYCQNPFSLKFNQKIVRRNWPKKLISAM